MSGHRHPTPGFRFLGGLAQPAGEGGWWQPTPVNLANAHIPDGGPRERLPYYQVLPITRAAWVAYYQVFEHTGRTAPRFSTDGSRPIYKGPLSKGYRLHSTEPPLTHHARWSDKSLQAWRTALRLSVAAGAP